MGEPRHASRQRTFGGSTAATPEERELLDSLATAYEEYYAGLRLGATIYAQTKSAEAYAATVERGKPFLAEADRLATQLGAPECTVRPFAETYGARKPRGPNGVTRTRTSEEWGRWASRGRVTPAGWPVGPNNRLSVAR